MADRYRRGMSFGEARRQRVGSMVPGPGHHLDMLLNDAQEDQDAYEENGIEGDLTNDSTRSNQASHGICGQRQSEGQIRGSNANVKDRHDGARRMGQWTILDESKGVRFHRMKKKHAERVRTIEILERKKEVEGITMQLHAVKAIRAKCRRSKHEWRSQPTFWDLEWEECCFEHSSMECNEPGVNIHSKLSRARSKDHGPLEGDRELAGLCVRDDRKRGAAKVEDHPYDQPMKDSYHLNV